jgi:DNA-binding transcriptional LysR family regulator
LAAVVREGSFERAAQALFVTPSAVSQRIRSLEERLGCALVVRGQPCRPTDAGRHLCQHVDRVRLFEQELQGALPAPAPDGLTRVALPIAVDADSLATWFVTAALGGMGWGLQPEALVAPHLAMGSLVELVPDTALDVSLCWQHARAASSLIDGLSQVVMAAAARALRPL